MDAKFCRILELENVNKSRIHLFRSEVDTVWVAYGKSDLNLERLVPRLERTETDLFLGDGCAQLFQVSIHCEAPEVYELLALCTLVGDDYMELTIPQSKIRSTKTSV